MIDSDHKFMMLAIRMARRNYGTAPNPSVACIIVKNNIIIATGLTGFGGRPHAESVAINNAKQPLNGATFYITLEPCSHFGQTSPCVDLIIAAKPQRVVIAAIDPDARVNGGGIAKLKAVGIEIVVGVLEEEARAANIGFFTAKKLQRPFVTLKLATSLDGKIATYNFDSKWITGEKARRYSHYLRAKNDGILVGANTIRQDDPMLDCRMEGLENHSPKRIVISNSLDINMQSKIISTACAFPTFIATDNDDQKLQQKFIDCGVKIIFIPALDLNILLGELAKLEINNLLIEGGGGVAAAFLKAQLIDQLIWMRSDMIIGNDGISAIGNLNLELLTQIEDKALKFNKIDERELGDDEVVIYNANSVLS